MDEIENPVGLNRHYEEKVKVLGKKGGRDERDLYFLHLSLNFSGFSQPLENSI